MLEKHGFEFAALLAGAAVVLSIAGCTEVQSLRTDVVDARARLSWAEGRLRALEAREIRVGR